MSDLKSFVQLTIDVREEDLKGAVPWNSRWCPVARACRRQLELSDPPGPATVRAELDYLYVGNETYLVPMDLRDAMTEYDQGAGFKLGCYTLKKLPGPDTISIAEVTK